MRELRIDSQAATDAVTVAEVKAYGKIPGSADDSLIEDMIKACRELQEEWTGRNYIAKVMTVHYNTLEGYEVELPMGPVNSIASVKRVYEDGTLSDSLVEGTDYFVKGMIWKTINLYKRWQSAGRIVTGLQVQYNAGHGSDEGQISLPAALKNALLRHVVTDYDQRDDLEQYNAVLYDWTREVLQPYKVQGLWL